MPYYLNKFLLIWFLEIKLCNFMCHRWEKLASTIAQYLRVKEKPTHIRKYRESECLQMVFRQSEFPIFPLNPI